MSAPSRPPDFDDLADGEDDARDYNRIWSLFRQTDDEAPSYDVDREWHELADRLDLEAASDTSSARDRRAADRDPRSTAQAMVVRLRRWSGALAVAILLTALVGGGAWWWTQPVEVRTAAGEQTVVTLPDGSSAELNGNTTISYPRRFAALPWADAPVRRVTLDGEAFFSVVSGDRPFRVETSNARVEVLGTEFNVRTRSVDGAPETAVAVASGRVRVASASGGPSDAAASVVLDEPGQQSRVRGRVAPTAPEPVALKYVGAYRQGGFAVFDAGLPTILQALERRFGVSLALRVPAAETEAMSLHYARDASLEAILRDICLTQRLSYRETSQGYELVPKEQ